MKVFKTQDISKIDDYTIKHEPIKSIDLMERATTTIFNWLIKKYKSPYNYYIFCGNGNNGGDGLALARMLANVGNNVNVYIINSDTSFSSDAKINFERLQQQNKANINFISALPDIPDDVIIIDALFGAGLNRSLEGFNATLVKHINKSINTVISIDIPSGLFGEDNSNNNRDAIIQATYTLSFEYPKLAFFLPENEKQTGKWEVLPIGLHKQSKIDTTFYFTTQQNIVPKLQIRKRFSNKGTYGKAMLIAGSYGMIGAAVLASKACLRTGVGLVKAHVPSCGINILQTSIPELIVSTDENQNHFTSIPKDINEFNSIAIGPGIGQNSSTQNVVLELIKNTNAKMLLDADALNILSIHKHVISNLPAKTIITPHRKEFERLVGKWSNDYECILMQIDFAVNNNLIVVLKGAYTSIATPDGNLYFNSTGNTGMATAGSGDVLTGIILSLLAQNYTAENAALLGVYIHGLAGDIAKNKQSEESLIASDIIQNIGSAFQQLHNSINL